MKQGKRFAVISLKCILEKLQKLADAVVDDRIPPLLNYCVHARCTVLLSVDSDNLVNQNCLHICPSLYGLTFESRVYTRELQIAHVNACRFYAA